MKKIYFILSLLATTVASAYAAVNPPTIGFPDNYLGTQFKATWEDAGADSYLFSLYTLGDNMMKFDETFANVNHSGGKINTANPNIPVGFSVDISKNGTTDVVYYNDRDHIVLDANDDKVSTTLMVGGNLSRCIFNANLINAQGITKENSSRFKVTLYDKAGDMISSGQVEAYYFYLKEEFDLEDAFGGIRSNIGKVVFEIVKDDSHNVGDIAINSIQYEYKAPVYVMRDKEVEGTWIVPTDLDAEKVYYYYVKAKNGSEVSDMSAIMYVDGFLSVNTLPASNIKSTSYTANWEYLPKALGYYVQPYRFDVVEDTKIDKRLDDQFSKATEGTTMLPISINSEDLDKYTDCTGWSGRNVLMAKGMIGADAGRFPMNMSYLHSPIMNLSANGGKYKIHLKAHGTAGDALNVYHVGYIVDGKLNMHTATFDKNGNIDEEWEMNDGDSETMLSFEDKRLKKFFIDEITVSQGLYKGDIITVKYDLVKLTDGKTTSYNFSGLEENKKYGYQVTGWRHNDVGGEVISGTSPIVYADLSIAAGIDDNVVANGDPKVSVSGNTVTVTLAQAAPIYVFTLDGCNKQTLSGKAGANTLTLAAGQVYIVKAGGRAYKVMAR